MNIVPKKFTRDFPLILCQIWGRRYKNIFGRDVTAFPRNISILQDGLATLYRGSTVNYEINTFILLELKKDKNFVTNLVRNNLQKVYELKNQCSRTLSRQEFVNFLNLLLDCWEGFFASLYLPPDDRFTKGDRDLVMDFRRKTGDLEYDAFNHIDTTLRHLFEDLGPLARYISLEEITDNVIPAKNILLKRQKEKLIVVDDIVLSEAEFQKLEKEFDFRLELEPDVSGVKEIKGQVACPGKVTGKVRLLMKNTDIGLVERGEILVTSMTVPTFLPAMERAAAFVTNEGGITCHAAIVAREMKKPCIIGTKIATKVLKDGDLVEVDAERGEVKIIKRE
ncbi:MAG: PEP-utilizing enzyme [Patescibacteria group bacterium]